MELVSEQVSYGSPCGPVSAHLSRPSASAEPLPGVLVIQEVWGVDAHIRDLTERFASAGYVALAPDLYSAGGGRPPALASERVDAAKAFLNTIPPGQWMAVLGSDASREQALAKLGPEQAAQVGETLGALFGGVGRDPAERIELLRAAVAFLRTHPACAGRAIASIGFCMGGNLSALLAGAEPELAAAAVFYGSAPSDEQASSIRCPIRGFYGQDDPRIVAGLPAFEQALGAAGVERELRIYPNAGHAFFNDTRPSYRPEAARDAWGRVLAFFAAALEPAPTITAVAAATALDSGAGA